MNPDGSICMEMFFDFLPQRLFSVLWLELDHRCHNGPPDALCLSYKHTRTIGLSIIWSSSFHYLTISFVCSSAVLLGNIRISSFFGWNLLSTQSWVSFLCSCGNLLSHCGNSRVCGLLLPQANGRTGGLGEDGLSCVSYLLWPILLDVLLFEHCSHCIRGE